MNKAAVKWLLRLAKKEQNPYMQAELLYQALGNGKPYPFSEARKHFHVFKGA